MNVIETKFLILIGNSQNLLYTRGQWLNCEFRNVFVIEFIFSVLIQQETHASIWSFWVALPENLFTCLKDSLIGKISKLIPTSIFFSAHH